MIIKVEFDPNIVCALEYAIEADLNFNHRLDCDS